MVQLLIVVLRSALGQRFATVTTLQRQVPAAQGQARSQGRMTRMTQRSSDGEAIETEIDRIRSLGLDDLRTLWRTTFRSSPPQGFTKDLVARFICWHIQERAFGGLDPETAKALDGVAKVVGITWPIPPEIDDAELERLLFTPPGVHEGSTKPIPDWRGTQARSVVEHVEQNRHRPLATRGEHLRVYRSQPWQCPQAGVPSLPSIKSPSWPTRPRHSSFNTARPQGPARPRIALLGSEGAIFRHDGCLK
jgi:hypothetical protein